MPNNNNLKANGESVISTKATPMTYPMRTDVYGMGFTQHDMFGAPQGSLEMPMTPEEIIAELTRKLNELRAADTMPWEAKELLRNTVMFPDMAGRLPSAEAAELTTAFDAEMARLRRRAA